MKRSAKKPQPRKPALLPSLLAALAARPDVTVLTRTWPVLFVQLRYALDKTVINEHGFSPLHRETPLFYGQAWSATHEGVTQMPIDQFAGYLAPPLDALREALGPMHPEVSARLGLSEPVERGHRITGAALER